MSIISSAVIEHDLIPLYARHIFHNSHLLQKYFPMESFENTKASNYYFPAANSFSFDVYTETESLCLMEFQEISQIDIYFQHTEPVTQRLKLEIINVGLYAIPASEFDSHPSFSDDDFNIQIRILPNINNIDPEGRSHYILSIDIQNEITTVHNEYDMTSPTLYFSKILNNQYPHSMSRVIKTTKIVQYQP